MVFKDLTTAWEHINEIFLDAPKHVLSEYSGTRHSQALYLYNFSFTVENPTFDPEFDFGRHFNYTKNKWGMLMGNYICKDELSSLKDELQAYMIGRKPYNLSTQFRNAHKHGKGCLLALCVTKRFNDPIPHLTMYLRASEVTKRLSVDLLLAQRLGEYLFGNKTFKITFNINQVFNDDTVLLMYYAHKPKLVKQILKNSKDEYAPRLYKRLQDMLTGDESKFKKYKVHYRAYKVVRPDLYEYPVTLAKDCKLPL